MDKTRHSDCPDAILSDDTLKSPHGLPHLLPQTVKTKVTLENQSHYNTSGQFLTMELDELLDIVERNDTRTLINRSSITKLK